MREEEVMRYVADRIPVDRENESLIQRQCGRACRTLGTLLNNEEKTPESLFCEASSALTVVYYLQYSMASGNSGVKSFKAGDVSVTEDSGDLTELLKQAEKNYHSCFTRLAPYLKEEAVMGCGEPFFFKGVGGCRFH